MADLTPLEEKLGEVLGLAQAAQAATEKVSGMEGAEDFQAELQRMHEQAAETEQRTDALVDGLEGRKSLELITGIYESIETNTDVQLRFRPKKCRLGLAS